MTYAEAKLIANSPLCYAPKQWSEAATLLLGSLTASDEDICEASDLIRRVSCNNSPEKPMHIHGLAAPKYLVIDDDD